MLVVFITIAIDLQYAAPGCWMVNNQLVKSNNSHGYFIIFVVLSLPQKCWNTKGYSSDGQQG